MRAKVAVAVLLLSALAAVAASDVEERDLRQAMGYAQRGLSSLGKGNTARAREDFERAVSKVPNLPDAHTGFGHIAMRERRFEDALREYRLAEAGAKEIGVRLLSMASERFATSRDELQRLRARQIQLVQETNRNEARGGDLMPSGDGMSSGQVARERAEVDGRIRALENMKAPTPDIAPVAPGEVLFFEGNALFNLKRTDEAIAVWQTATVRLPEFAPLHNNLAVAYWMTGRIDDAWAALKRAESLGFKVNPSFRADLERAGGQP
jgi:tetratricopeptide (TPR) repeat protein